MGGSAQAQFSEVAPCPLMLPSFIRKPLPSMMQRSIGTWSAARMPLSSSTRKWTARWLRLLWRRNVGPRAAFYTQVSAQTVSFYLDLSGATFGGNPDFGGGSHQPEARVLEAAAVGSPICRGSGPRGFPPPPPKPSCHPESRPRREEGPYVGRDPPLT